jgi:hypothetical protein
MARGFHQLRVAALALAGALVLFALQACAPAEGKPGDGSPPDESRGGNSQVGDVVAEGRIEDGKCVFDTGWGVGGPVREGRVHTVRVEIVEINDGKCQAVVTEVSSTKNGEPPDLPWRSDDTPVVDPGG